ncbi:unnamed protein product [Symbiodinium necroappetens]|uniref:Feruloyl esterase n=1 Tax=Symbiodinium necroappetens TaxID=1628268 RepID=A0A812QAM8_9DINO|nr:unnamed protein product [Symbiodinium necroappetens]
MLSLTDTMSLAKKHSVALLVLEGLDLALNVVADAQDDPSRPDDVGYTQAVLSDARGRACLDLESLYCIGSSRGARFCSRLASELPGLRGLLVNGGLRFPRPNNASQPLPVVSIHDEQDSVNPFFGGGPAYWGESVPSAVQAWSSFNGCKEKTLMSVEPMDGAWLERHTSCDSFAEVWLLVTSTGRHKWPGNVFTELAWQVMQRQQMLREGSQDFADLGGPDWPQWPLYTGLAHALRLPFVGFIAGALLMA